MNPIQYLYLWRNIGNLNVLLEELINNFNDCNDFNDFNDFELLQLKSNLENLSLKTSALFDLIDDSSPVNLSKLIQLEEDNPSFSSLSTESFASELSIDENFLDFINLNFDQLMMNSTLILEELMLIIQPLDRDLISPEIFADLVNILNFWINFLNQVKNEDYQ